jgi:formylglycine-generating enzyme required for sulfatase activity
LLQLHLAAFRLESQIVRSNPLLDFERLLVVRRSVASPRLGLPQNWQSNCVLPASGFDDQIAVLSPLSPAAPLTTLYRPSQPVFVGDVDLHFDAERLLFSSLGTHGRWQIFEIGTDGSGLRQVTPGEHADVNNYDACYLPDERIVFSSTASMAAVPCVNGSTRVANLYRMDADGRNIRQLCFDQEHNWCPTMLPNGRVLYLRWEYTDTPHSHDRVLFQMNPDGTGQMEYYGSNSYWPNSLFYARPIPGQPTQFVGIVGGHHGVPRMGELVLFDVARGRREADGAIQRIPGHGQPVEAIIADNLVDASWPKFLHPFPLNERYFLVAAQQTPQSLWGIYLVDVFDGMTLLREEPGYALLEPVPLRPTPRPPVIPDRVDLSSREGIVYLSDIYAGDGLAGVPRGAVKQLRVLSYHYLYPGMGGPQGVIGMEGPWDIKRILGTVPVEADGSAVFRVPANTPISLQPLDEEGKALQLMRSWLTAMPGEVLSCVGCHESQSSGPPSKRTLASTRRPSEIAPWHGPPRGFNFAREVQPVLDRYCVGCHDGQVRPDGTAPADLRGLEKIAGYTSKFHFGAHDAGHFSTSYAELHRYVRRPGLESDYHLLTPLEYHADTTRLVQLLRKGHFGVQLDAEAWDRLITWIDLNAPYHGTWIEIAGEARVRPLAQRRRELLRQYAGLDVDFEAIYPPAGGPVTPVIPAPPPPTPRGPSVAVRAAGWPFDAAEAQRRQTALGWTPQTVEVGNEVSLELVAIPPGEFVMGDDAGYDDERPRTVVRIERPFWIGRCEVTNEQFAQFDPSHDSRVESKHAMQFGVRGFYVNGPKQPVVRVSWEQATAFCQWLSAQTGRRFALPTEAQWEYACRAGAETPFSFGDRTADFSPHANMADLMLREVVCDPYNKARAPFANPGPYDDWIPKDERYSDGGFVSEDVGRWLPNAWGLCEMHGNVSEWTRSAYRPYPYDEHDGRNDAEPAEPRVARGGSWRDCPADCRAACRFPYRSYQPVYNVGFRIVCEEQ